MLACRRCDRCPSTRILATTTTAPRASPMGSEWPSGSPWPASAGTGAHRASPVQGHRCPTPTGPLRPTRDQKGELTRGGRRIRKVSLTKSRVVGQTYSASHRSAHQALATFNWMGHTAQELATSVETNSGGPVSGQLANGQVSSMNSGQTKEDLTFAAATWDPVRRRSSLSAIRSSGCQ